jgi:[ribosomal protein S5]-alanine N-acetyltransferase
MIKTNRLKIIPLTYIQLLSYLKNDNSLEAELGVGPSFKIISSELKEAFEQTILPNVANAKNNYLYHTLWSLIDKNENKIVGDFCIVGEPDAIGQIEIGYGTYDTFKNKGYMTEAVEGFIAWAKSQPELNTIVADTEKENIASYKILEKNNFIKIAETETLFKWKLKL